MVGIYWGIGQSVVSGDMVVHWAVIFGSTKYIGLYYWELSRLVAAGTLGMPLIVLGSGG